jgi:integrase
MGRPRLKRTSMWSCESVEWMYRRPFEARKKWRVRRRHKFKKAPDGGPLIEMLTLKAGNLTAAQREVEDLVHQEKALAGVDDGRREQTEMPWGLALDAWLETVDVRPATRRGYAGYVRLYKKLLDEKRNVREFKYADVEALFTTGKWATRSGRTKILHRGILIRVWGWFIKRGWTTINIPEQIEIQKRWSKESSKAAQETGQALSPPAARKLLRFCREPFLIDMRPDVREEGEEVPAENLTEMEPSPSLWLFTFLGLATGLRKSNLLGGEGKPPLRWGMIDLKKKLLRIPGEFMKNDLDFQVPLSEEVVKVLEERLRALGRRPEDTEAIIAPFDVRKQFGAALRRAGLAGRGLRVHDLRHSFLSWAGEVLPHAVVQFLAGHAARTVTDRYSKHQRREAVRRGLALLPPLLTGSEKEEAEDVDGGAAAEVG